jgi:hypothetical protein
MLRSVSSAQRFLIESRLPQSGWGYTRTAASAYPEPTCYSLLALADSNFEAQEPLAWLSGLVNPQGQLFLPNDDLPNWASALLIVTLTHLDALPQIRASSAQWLLEWKSKYVEEKQNSIQLDASIVGWSWISDTFSWVQPTSMAVLALKKAGLGSNQRVKDGERLLLNRVCRAGGWNFGNPIVFESELEPRPMDTAIALFALQDAPGADEAIARGLAVIEERAPAASSTLSLALGILSMDIFGRPVETLVKLLKARQSADGSWGQNVWWTALAACALQVADGGRNAFRIEKA